MSKTAPVVAPTLAEFEATHENVSQVAIQTPVLHSNYLSFAVHSTSSANCR
ncbi:MAG: hypothetical protein RL716_245 [Actinomycetota bacterium]